MQTTANQPTKTNKQTPFFEKMIIEVARTNAGSGALRGAI
jgi:hypothetical protein